MSNAIFIALSFQKFISVVIKDEITYEIIERITADDEIIIDSRSWFHLKKNQIWQKKREKN